MSDVRGGGEGLDSQTSDPESPADLELCWQNLLDILQSENMDVGLLTAFNRASDSGTSGMFGAGAQSHQQHLETHGTENQSGQTRFFLTPSAELEDHTSEDMRTTLGSSDMDSLQPAANYTHLFGDGPIEDFVLGLDGEDSFTTFDLSPLTQDLMDRTESERLLGSDSRQLPEMDLTLLLCEEDADDLTNPLSELLENSNILEDLRLLDKEFIPETMTRLGEEVQLHGDTAGADVRELRRKGQSLRRTPATISDSVWQNQTFVFIDCEDEPDSDSGLSLDFSHSPASSCGSFTSASSDSPCCVSAVDSLFSEEEKEDPGGGVTVKLEEEEIGEAGGRWEDVRKLSQTSVGDHERFHSCSWMEHVGHDHTYSQCLSSAGSQRHPKQKHGRMKPHRHRSSGHMSGNSQDERRAWTFKIPFSNELIVHLPVEAFNDLLGHYQLAEEQLALIRDIRRRGKNKIAAHNCRKRKQNVLLGLESQVSSLRHRRSQLLRERREVMRHMSQMKQTLELMYQEVFSNLRDEEGRLLDATAYMLHFGPGGGVAVASVAADITNKQRDNRK